MPRTITPATTRTPNPVRSIAPAAPAVTLTFTLEEARDFRTGLGTLTVLYDALAADMRNVSDDENHVIDAARIAALYRMTDAALSDFGRLQVHVSDLIESAQAEERHELAATKGAR